MNKNVRDPLMAWAQDELDDLLDRWKQLELLARTSSGALDPAIQEAANFVRCMLRIGDLVAEAINDIKEFDEPSKA